MPIGVARLSPHALRCSTYKCLCVFGPKTIVEYQSNVLLYFEFPECRELCVVPDDMMDMMVYIRLTKGIAQYIDLNVLISKHCKHTFKTLVSVPRLQF